MDNQTRWVGLLAGAFSLFASAQALAQARPTCGPEVKANIVRALENAGATAEPESEAALKLQAQLYEQYKFCASDPLPLPDDGPVCGKIAYKGSTYYERMRCCGYDPQHQFFACPVEVLQPTGFGNAPMPGSFEHVLTCVDQGAGWVVAARDNVHLADAVGGAPVWNFQVFARARSTLAKQPLQGQTVRARSILSWGLVPTGCNYQPIWGDVLDYQIRLDR